MLSSGQQDSFS